ncbi:hypothetical protein OE88DRAFT_1654479 [Heliocybe sulcata]|uniref:Uncharacterized protein n=1 Tax=Heliocybe sulcata TaxID=5364 RepID=A0A5C3N9U4_9AGAM|nr:hypothetical protein OE88DRAFT_1654479 [Heliocybe sulcata]
MSRSRSSSPSSDYRPSDDDSDKENNENSCPQDDVTYDSEDEREPPRKHYAQLDTTKINRLLRPLKAKCTHLANFSEAILPSTGNTGPRMITTYSHRPRATRVHRPHSNRTQPLEPESSIPPLAVLAEPEMMRPTRLQRLGDAGMMELSRRIYAIRDCFKNILDNVYQKDMRGAAGYSARMSCTGASEEEVEGRAVRPRWIGYEPSKQRIPSLRVLCSVVAGRHMKLEKPELNDGNSLVERDVGETVGIDEEAEVIDELYNSVFPPYRQRTLVSHALTHILDTEKVNRNQTLLKSLLEIVLDYDPPLVPESHAVVRALLSVALTQNPNKRMSPPPVCHDSHVSWLDDLHRACTDQDPQHHYPPPETGPLRPKYARKPGSPIPPPTLIGIMLDILQKGSVEDALEVWTCKAMTRFLDNMRQNDQPCYFLLLTGMADAITRGAVAKDTLEALEDEEALLGVQSAFCDILRSLLRWVCPSSTSIDGAAHILPKKQRRRWFGAAGALSSPSRSEALPVPDKTIFGKPATLDDVQEIVDFLIHISPCGLHASNVREVSELIICLLAVCAVDAPVPETSILPSDKAKLEAMLKEATPSSTAFEYLTDGILHRTLVVLSSAHAHTVDSSWDSFSGFAERLRASKLLRLEASWWVCALKSYDHIHEGRIVSASSLFTSRKECDKWEKCRGWLVEEVERSERAVYGGEEWEWEEMIGCWVKKASGKRRGRSGDDEERMDLRYEERVKRRRMATPEPEEEDFSLVLGPGAMDHFSSRSTASSPDPISSFAKSAWTYHSAEPPLASPSRSDRSDDSEDERWVRQATDPDSVLDTFSSDDALDLFAYGSPP